MHRRIRPLFFVALTLVLIGRANAIDLEQEKKSVEEWRTGRIERLAGPTGWLTLAGLYWLHDGENTFGRSKKNATLASAGYPGLQ